MTERLVVTNSELGSFRTCRKRWHYAYEERWRPKHKARALAVGSIIHRGIEAMYRVIHAAQIMETPGRPLSIDELTISALQGMSGALDKYTDSLDDLAEDAADDERKQELIETSRLARNEASGSVVRFVERFALEDQRRYEIVAVEQTFRVPLLGPDGKPLSRIMLAGQRDLVLRDRERRDIILSEHKSCRGSAAELDLRLDVDAQVRSYMYALTLDFPNDQVGRLFYNAVRKTGPKTPHVNKNGLISTAQCDTTQDVYAGRLREQEQGCLVCSGHGDTSRPPYHVPAEGKAKKAGDTWMLCKACDGTGHGKPITDDQRQRLAALPSVDDKYVSRWEDFISPEQVRQWQVEAWEDARLMRRTRRKHEPIAITRNSSSCTLPWQPPCPYRGPCSGAVDEGYEPAMSEDFERVHVKHVELEPKHTDEDER